VILPPDTFLHHEPPFWFSLGPLVQYLFTLVDLRSRSIIDGYILTHFESS
jgi:hypothetical protein